MQDPQQQHPNHQVQAAVGVAVGVVGGAIVPVPPGGGGGRAAKRRPPKAGLAREDAQRPRQVTFAEELTNFRSFSDEEEWIRNNPIPLDGVTHEQVARNLAVQHYAVKHNELAKDEPDEIFQARCTGWKALHNSKTPLRNARGEEVMLSEAQEVIFGSKAAALKLVPHVQQMADFVCAFKPQYMGLERKAEKEDSPAARMLNPQPVLNPVAEVDGVPPSELPKDHPLKWVSAGQLPDGHPSKYINVQDFYNTSWEYCTLRAVIAHAEHPNTVARLTRFAEERGWGSHALVYGEVAIPPTLIAAPPRWGKSTPTDQVVMFAHRLGMTITYGCAPHTTVVCREFKERMEKLGWWDNPHFLGKCISLADVSGDSAASAASAAERCKAALAAESYDFILYSSENSSHCQAIHDDVERRHARLSTEQEGGPAVVVDDPNRTCVFCHFRDEAQNNARFGAEDAKHKYEKKLRALQEAQQAYQAARARREAGHEDVSARRVKYLEDSQTAQQASADRAKTEFERKLRACQEHLRPTFVSSRGYQVLISATLLPTLQEHQLYGTLFCKLDPNNPDEDAILKIGAERYLLPPIQPAGAGSYVGVQQMVPPKYSEASGYTRHKVRTRTIRLLEENFDHQINQMNAWIEAIEANISAYQADNRKRWQKAARDNAPLPPVRPDNDPVFETMRAKCRTLQASIAEATQRKVAFRAGGLVPAITDAMWRDPFLKDKDLLRLDGGGLFNPRERTLDPALTDVPKDVSTAEPRWPDLPRVRKVAQAARGLVWIEAGLGDLGPRSKLLDAVEDVPAEQPLRLPMTIVCPHSETNRMDHTKANTQLDWAFQIARANVRKQQNSLIAIYASGIDCKKIACSFPGVAMLANDNAKDNNKHSDGDRQVTVIETGRTATGAWAIKTIQRAVSNMDGVVDMLKANGSRLEDMATFNLYVVGYEMFNGALTLSRFTSADVGVTDVNGAWQKTGTRTVHMLPNRVLFAHTGNRCIDSIYQIAGRACNDMPYEVEHRIEVLSGQHTVSNTKAFALAEVQWCATLGRVAAGADDAYQAYADAVERQQRQQQEDAEGVAVDYDDDAAMQDADPEPAIVVDEGVDDPTKRVEPYMSLNYAGAAYRTAGGLIDDESLSAFALDDLCMGRMKIKAGATFGNGEALSDEQQQQLQRQVDQSSIFRAERWEDGRPAPAPAAPAAPAPAAPQPDAQGFYATSLVEFKQLYHDMLPRHIRDNGEHYADSVVQAYLHSIDHTFVEKDVYFSDRIGADNMFEVAEGMEHKLCFPDDLPNGANDPRWHGPHAYLRLRLNSENNHNRHTSGVVATYKVFKHLLPNEGDPLTRIFKSSRRAAPAVGAHVGLDAE